MPEKSVPNTGTRKLNTATLPTLLNLNSSVHITNANEDINAIYIRSIIDLGVKPISFPPQLYPSIVNKIPPINNWYPVTVDAFIWAVIFLLYILPTAKAKVEIRTNPSPLNENEPSNEPLPFKFIRTTPAKPIKHPAILFKLSLSFL